MDAVLDLYLNDPRSGLFVTTTAIAFLILAPLAAEVRARTFSLWGMKTIFLIFILFQFAVWPIIMYVPRYDRVYLMDLTFWTSGYDEFLRGQYCVIAGLIAFHLGYYRALRVNMPPLMAGWIKRETPITDKTYRSILFGSVAVTSLAFSAMMASSGGVAYFVQNIDKLRNTEAAGWGLFLFPIISAQVGITLSTARAMEARKSLALPLLGTFLQLGCALVIGMRMLLIAPIVSLLICYHIHVRPIRLTFRMTIGIVLFLVFNMWYALFRGTGEASLTTIENVPLDLFLLALFGRFHGGESMARIISVTDVQGYNYGLINVQDFLVSLLPRAVFPNKPPSAGVIANTTFWPELFSADDTGAAVTTLFGEAYWALGALMVVVVLYLHGVLFQRVERDMARRGPIQTTVYCVFFVYAMFVNETFNLHFFQLSFRLATLAGILALVAKQSRVHAGNALTIPQAKSDLVR